MHSNFGFVPQNVMLVESDLHMAGYTDEHLPQMQRRMLDAAAAIPGVTAVGYVDHLPLGLGGGDSYVFSDTHHRLPADQLGRRRHELQHFAWLHRSRGHTAAGGQRSDLVHDDSKAPNVALVNRQFAVKVFGSVNKAVGGHFKFYGGIACEVVGVVEDGKYRTLTEDQQPAMFFSFQQQQSSGTWLLVQVRARSAEIARALEQHAARP